MAVRGEVFWVLTDENDEFLQTRDVLPTKIWPLSPDFFEPIQQGTERGELIGWRFRVPTWMPQAMKHLEMSVPLESVVQFKYPNLSTLLRGQARISPALQAVLTDVMYHEYNKQLLANGGDPGGLIEYDSEMSPDEEREYLESFDQRHAGTGNANRTAMLSGGFKYTQIGVVPKDMQGLEQQDWDRASILAVQGTPPSVLGVTDFVNYATQLGQDKNFWDKTLIPLLTLVETTLDGTLFFSAPDNIVGLFDLTDIEALRSGIMEKVEIATKFTGVELHMPPRVAFNMVGLEVEDYDGVDDVFINPVLTTVTQSLEDIENPPEPVIPEPLLTPSPSPAPAREEETRTRVHDLLRGEAKVAYNLLRKRIARTKVRRWEEFQRLETPHEKMFGKQYNSWVRDERRITLALFDDATKSRGLHNWTVLKQEEELFVTLPSEVLSPLQASANRLQAKTHPAYVASQEDIITFTIEGDLGGVPTFALDDVSMQQVLIEREGILLRNTPATLQSNLNLAIAEGVQNGESIRAIRNRIVGVFDGQISPAKTLQVARTETAGIMNSTRDEMFKQQGFVKELWVTAGDEIVREDHVTFGGAGPQKRDFNYMTLVSGGGLLRFPNDAAAPVGQIVNCRCIKIPVE